VVAVMLRHEGRRRIEVDPLMSEAGAHALLAAADFVHSMGG
jgi:hypothetical protein